MSEIQSTMSVRELDLWGKYRKKYGPMDPVRMFDKGFALVASMISQANGGKAKPIDFMPYGRDNPSEDTFVDPDEFVNLLKMTGRTRERK